MIVSSDTNIQIQIQNVICKGFMTLGRFIYETSISLVSNFASV